MSYWKDYGYVDAQYEHPVHKTKSKWYRLRVVDVPKRIVAKGNAIGCFTSVQRYKDATSMRDEAEAKAQADAAQTSPPKKNGHDPSEQARIDREKEADELPDRQPHYHGLYFDFDADPDKLGCTVDEALGKSLADTRALCEWFVRMFPDLARPHIQVWYSGRKGFHVIVRPEPFGIRPHNHLTYVIQRIALELKNSLKLVTLDKSVYTVSRLWRIANTIHPKGGKYKIELTLDELLHWSPSQIQTVASGPRNTTGISDAWPDSHVYPEQVFHDIAPLPEAVQFFAERFQAYDAYRDLKNLSPKRSIVRPEDDSDFPACVNDIMTNGPKPGGPNRNRVILPLAGFFHDAGLAEQEAKSQIEGWTKTHYPQDAHMPERLANGRSVVESAYHGRVKFSCRFIRSLNGPGEKGRVACVTEAKCPWIQSPADQEPAKIPELHLSEASKGCYVGTKIKTAVHIAAVAGAPFELPVKAKIVCTPSPTAPMCEKCPNNWDGGNGKLELTFDAEDRHVLDLVNVNDSNRKGTIRAKAGIPRECAKNRVEVLESSNLEELQIIPMVDYARSYQIEMEEDSIANKEKHVVRLAYFLGHGIEPNKKYLIETTVFGHPKDQRVCFLFDKAEPAQNDIDQFHMTKELQAKLRIFNPREGQTVEQKLLEIHRDMTANVHQIGGRVDLSLAVDLCYHSVIGFKFAGQVVHKGWFELLVIGDSGTGKSTLVERMIRHYGLGEIVAGEDAKRTGLVYASIQMQGKWVLQWGKIPTNDRRLLVIDEFSGIPSEEVKKMTQLRSEGRAHGGGVNNNYETWARARLILLTNPRNNRGQLELFNYGINAVDDLFDDSADIRRVDLVVIAKKDEVKTELINRRWDQTELAHQYTADLCRSGVLWAWSREPHQIEWQHGAEDWVLKHAEELGDRYACDIPLAEKADLRLKIARIAASVAARLFSTDADAKKVLVSVAHVDFAAKFMDRLYRKQSMAYFEYAKKYKANNHYTAEKKDQIPEDFLKSFKDETDNIVGCLLDAELLSKPTFADMVNIENEDLKKLWKFLVGEQLLRRTARGYRKTGAFTVFLRNFSGVKIPYAGDLDPNFESGGTDQSDTVDFFDEAPETEVVKEEEVGEEPPF